MLESGSARPVRPRLHFTPPRGWMNDPMGVTRYDGRFHLFYQHVPDSFAWTPRCRWGHASSADLLTWTDHGTVLEPGDGELGCWSGSVAVPDGPEPPTIFYTSVTEDWAVGTVRTATPDDASWATWSKGGVVVQPPPDVAVRVYRDPFVFRDGDRWRMLVGAGLEDGTACALAYTAEALSELSDPSGWAYSGILARRDRETADAVWTGGAWECPHLVRVGDLHALVVSVWAENTTHYVAAAVGDYHDGRFEAHQWQQLTYGEAYYAGTTFRDGDDQPCLMMWVRGVGGPDQGWVGAQSVPLRLGVDRDGFLTLRPHPGLERRRAPADGGSDCWDVEWRPAAGAVLRVADGAGTTLLAIASDGHRLEVDAGSTRTRLPYAHAPVRVVVDGPVVEVVTGRSAAAAPILPSDGRVRVDVEGAGAADVWALA